MRRLAPLAVVLAAACIDFRSSLEDFCDRNPSRCAAAGGSAQAGGSGSTAGGAAQAGGSVGGGSGGGSGTAGGAAGGAAGGSGGGRAGGSAGGSVAVCTDEVCHVESFKVAAPLFDVNTIEPADLWMVGGSSVVYRWVDGGFRSMTDPQSSRLFAVAGSSPRDVWLGGFDAPNLFRFNGSSYVVVPYDGGSGQTTGLVSYGRDEVYLIDGTNLYQYDGGSWENVFDVGGSTYFGGVWGAPGAPLSLSVTDTVYQYPGSAPPAVLPIGGAEVQGMKVLPTTEAWAVGTGGSVARRFLDGGWEKIPVNIPPFTTTDFWGVHATALDECWVGGEEGAILHWREGIGWTQHRAVAFADAGASNIDIIWFDLEGSGKDLWFVGGKGALGNGNYDAGVVAHLRTP